MPVCVSSEQMNSNAYDPGSDPGPGIAVMLSKGLGAVPVVDIVVNTSYSLLKRPAPAVPSRLWPPPFQRLSERGKKTSPALYPRLLFGRPSTCAAQQTPRWREGRRNASSTCGRVNASRSPRRPLAPPSRTINRGKATVGALLKEDSCRKLLSRFVRRHRGTGPSRRGCWHLWTGRRELRPRSHSVGVLTPQNLNPDV